MIDAAACPQWLAPQLRELRQCFETPLNLHVLRRAMLLLVRAHWAHADNFGELQENLDCMTYAGPDAAQGLSIELTHTQRVDAERRIPAIFVSVAGGSAAPMTLNSMGFLGDSLAPHAVEDDDNRLEVRKKMTYMVRVHHIHESLDVSTLMATSTMDFLAAGADALRDNFGLREFDVVGLGEVLAARKPQPNREFEHVCSARVVADYSITVQERTHKLKRWMSEIQIGPAQG